MCTAVIQRTGSACLSSSCRGSCLLCAEFAA
jgi:hypothetical protein